METYRLNKYLYYKRNHKKCIILNLYNGIILSLQGNEMDYFERLAKQKIFTYEDNPHSIFEPLYKNNIIIQDGTKENIEILERFRKNYNSKKFHLTFFVTESCNFNCSYCFVNKSVQNTISNTTIDTIIDTIKKKVEKNAYREITISWFGGEPLLAFSQIVYFLTLLNKYCSEKSINLSNIMVTNGYLLDLKKFEELYKLGIRKMQITFDGYKDKHNTIRIHEKFEDTFDKIFSNLIEIRNIKYDDFGIIVRCNYSKKHPDDVSTDNSIRFDNVSFSYTDTTEKLALNGITLTISNNQKIALVGHNGAGKSTLVNLLTRLYDPLAGTIYLNNKDYKDYKISELRDSFLIIFQDSQKYAVSIAENILMREVRTRDDEIAVMEALRKVDLYDKVQSFKNGIHSILTKEFDNEGIVLSGGETQKLVAARVLTSRARVIVLDEITSNMDAMAEHEIFERVIEYARDKMVLFISHRLSMSKSADKIYVIEDGRIIEEGTHKELMNVASKYRDMFMVQAEKYGEG